MSGAAASLQGSTKQISVDAVWGSNSAAAPATILSRVGTLTVPIGNPGNITLGLSDTTLSVDHQYSKNGGANTTFSNGTVLTGLVTGDTLRFRCLTPAAAGGTMLVTTTDNVTGVGFGGTWTGTPT